MSGSGSKTSWWPIITCGYLLFLGFFIGFTHSERIFHSHGGSSPGYEVLSLPVIAVIIGLILFQTGATWPKYRWAFVVSVMTFPVVFFLPALISLRVGLEDLLLPFAIFAGAAAGAGFEYERTKTRER